MSYRRRAPRFLGQPPPPPEEPLAPWFAWAMAFGFGAVVVYAMLPPEPAPPRQT